MARTRGVARSCTVRYSGPFFERDPAKTVDDNITTMMASLAELGERDVKQRLQAGQSTRWPLGGGIRPGRVSGHVVGRVVGLRGNRWRRTAKVSVRNEVLTPKQAIKLMAAASWLEGTVKPFRRAAASMRRSGRRAADLAKGLE